MVRARRDGDIEKLWPHARVTECGHSDYRFRAPVTVDAIIDAFNAEILRISYSNFKDSVGDKALHDAYLNVWSAMAKVQPTPPYLGWVDKEPPKRKRRKRRGL